MLFIFILGLLLTTSLLEIKGEMNVFSWSLSLLKFIAQQKDLAGEYKSNNCDSKCCCPEPIELATDSNSNGSYSFKDFQIQGPNCTLLNTGGSSVSVEGKKAIFQGVTVTLHTDRLQIDGLQVFFFDDLIQIIPKSLNWILEIISKSSVQFYICFRIEHIFKFHRKILAVQLQLKWLVLIKRRKTVRLQLMVSC